MDENGLPITGDNFKNIKLFQLNDSLEKLILLLKARVLIMQR